MTGQLKTLAATFGVAAALVATIVLEPLPLYIWNASASVPIGLYRLRPAKRFHVTELVAVQPPEPLASFLDLNGYLPTGVPMLKRVLALPGQTVCRSGLTISVENIAMGEARDRDGRGRSLPKWQGCRVVGDGELFLMNWQSDASFDGRYFGFLPAAIKCRTIPPSRPKLARPTRATAVQDGRTAGAKRLYPGPARARRHACICSRGACALPYRCSWH
jgi:conjugative transfer signal peptidase TraF